MFFLQVQSSPLSGQPPKQPCMGGSQSSLTCGLLESYSQSWSPKEECHTQVRAGPSRGWPRIGGSLPTLPSKPHTQLSAQREFEELGQGFSQGKAELGAPVGITEIAAAARVVPGFVQTAASTSAQPTPVRGACALWVGARSCGSRRNKGSGTALPKENLQTLAGKRRRRAPTAF